MDPVEVNYLWDNHLVFSFDARARVRRTRLYRSDSAGPMQVAPHLQAPWSPYAASADLALLILADPARPQPHWPVSCGQGPCRLS
jgi:hypothetical protein